MDTNIKPKVSIELCTYNRADFLLFAIESVLNQTFQDWELLILDDASTDTTEEVVRFYLSDSRIRYIKHPHNLGLGKNRAAGVIEARGEYLAILDSDDYWNDPEKLSKQVAYLETHPEVGFVGTMGIIVNEKDEEKGKLSYHTNDTDIRGKILSYNQFLHSSVVFRMSTISEAGNYDATLAPAEDYDLILKVGTRHQLANLPEYSTSYRIHLSNSSSNAKKQRVQHAQLHLEIIKKYKNSYQNYIPALIKAHLRILKSSLGI